MVRMEALLKLEEVDSAELSPEAQMAWDAACTAAQQRIDAARAAEAALAEQIRVAREQVQMDDGGDVTLQLSANSALLLEFE